MPHHVWVFFYGSYINLDVLAEVELRPEYIEVAQLHGFDLQIAPRANLVLNDRATVFGILAMASHAELTRLYVDHAKGKLGEEYLPEAVLTIDSVGKYRPAMTYLCHDMTPRPAERAYVDRIAGPAERLGFPNWYVSKIRSFAPT